MLEAATFFVSLTGSILGCAVLLILVCVAGHLVWNCAWGEGIVHVAAIAGTLVVGKYALEVGGIAFGLFTLAGYLVGLIITLAHFAAVRSDALEAEELDNDPILQRRQFLFEKLEAEKQGIKPHKPRARARSNTPTTPLTSVETPLGPPQMEAMPVADPDEIPEVRIHKKKPPVTSAAAGEPVNV